MEINYLERLSSHHNVQQTLPHHIRQFLSVSMRDKYQENVKIRGKSQAAGVACLTAEPI